MTTIDGLSPRVRGSQYGAGGTDKPGGSIPASAGQPPVCQSAHTGGLVYPRECGAAANVVRFMQDKDGLSPRVRGSHPESQDGRRDERSIPASAGQPEPLRTGAE